MNIYEGLQLTREVGTMYTVAVMLPITGEGVVPAFLQFGSLEEAEAFKAMCDARKWVADIAPPIKLLVMASPQSAFNFCAETIYAEQLKLKPAASESLN